MTLIAPTLQRYFSDRLMNQRDASPQTIRAYRHAFRLLLQFAEQRTSIQPSNLDIEDLNAELISAFLTHLEIDRGNTVRTRNARLAAIHSLYRYAALRHPEHAHTIARVIEIPPKRYQRATIAYLSADEITALLNAPDRGTWHGRRDHALILTSIQTGLRVSEMVGLKCGDLTLGTGGHCRVIGKGRKHRCTPLTHETRQVLRVWLAERHGEQHEPLFATRRGAPLSRDAVAWLLDKHAGAAAKECPSLAAKRVTPHVLRHTSAMLLRAAGVDLSVIALWLGHEGLESTQMYLHADLTLKEQAIARTAPTGTPPGRYRPTDDLLAYLDSL